MTLPVVWVPGHLCGAWLYRPQIEAFSERPAIIAGVDRDDDLAAMARRLLARAPERFVIAGLSMGGMVAMEAMAAAPGRVAGAVLMDTDPRPARERELAFRAEQRKVVAERGLEPAVRDFAGRFFRHDPAGAGRHLEEVVRRMCETPVAVYERQARALDGRREMAPRLAGITAPVAILFGAEDAICPPKLHAPLAEALPHASTTELPGIGHLATIEAPGPVNAAIARLLSRIG